MLRPHRAEPVPSVSTVCGCGLCSAAQRLLRTMAEFFSIDCLRMTRGNWSCGVCMKPDSPMKYWIENADKRTCEVTDVGMLQRAVDTARLAYARSQSRYHEALQRLQKLQREMPPMSEAKVLRQVDVILAAQAFVRELEDGRPERIMRAQQSLRVAVQGLRSVEYALAFGEADELDTEAIELEVRKRHG